MSKPIFYNPLLFTVSASYIFHNAAKAALQNDGWTVTEPLYLRWGDDQLRIDLAAERLIVAERAHEKIAVEVKSFVGTSAITDFHLALGQFLNYRAVLQIKQPERQLYLAVTTEIYRTFFRRDLPKLSVQTYQIKLLIFDPTSEVVEQWIN